MGPLLQQSVIWLSESEDGISEPSSVGFRKKIELSGSPKSAEIMIFADSRYILWINGEYIDRGPCRFDPKGPQYDVINVVNHLHKGTNIISIMVQANIKGSLKVMKHRPGLTAVMRIDNQLVVTDESWICSDQIPEQIIKNRWTWSCILDSVDANVRDFNWQSTQFRDNHWKPAVKISGDSWGSLTPRSIPLLRETDLGSGTLVQIRSKKKKTTDTLIRKLPDYLPVRFDEGDEIVIDAGRLSLTYWKIDMEAEQGTEIVFTPCQDFVGGETIISYNSITTYKAREGNQTYMTGDTFGFRYLNIMVLKGSIFLKNIHFTSRLYPNISIAQFECNDEFLNDTWQQTSYSSEVLCEDGYVDSAERAEWMGDVGMIQYPVSRKVISGPGGQRNEIIYSDPRLLRNMLIHTAQSQQEDGRLKAHHPSDRFDLHWYIEDYSCLWVQGLRQYFENTTDVQLVERLWPVLKNQMDWFLERKNGCGLMTAREFLIHLDNPMRYQICQGATVNAFIYKALLDAAYLGKVLERREDVEYYQKEADSLKSAFNRMMWDESSGSVYAAVYYPVLSPGEKLPGLKLVPIEDPASESEEWHDGNVQWIEKGEKVPPTVQAALVSLNMGIISDDHADRTRRYLLNHFQELKNPYTHLLLFDEFYKYDQDSLDLEVLNIIRRRWKNMVSRKSPGTSAEGFETQGYLCHPFGLVPAYVLPSYVLGVRMTDPVWDRNILIEPRLGDLTYVRGIALTEHGPVSVDWQRTPNQSLTFKFEIPEEVEANIRMPKQGSHNEIILNGKSIDFISDGRFLEFKVTSGSYTGIVLRSPE